MGSDWKTIKLQDFADHQKGFAFKSKDYIEQGIAVVRVSNLTRDSIDCSDLKFVSEQVAQDKEQFRLSPNDVVIATVGSWPKNPASVVGKVIRVPEACDAFLLNQNAVRFRAKSGDDYDQLYLYYLLKSKTFSDYIVSTAQGSANQASITLKDIYAFEFNCPTENERRRIALQLSSLDDKTALNTQINQTLEQMAQTLFKSWFVDFDPVIDNALDVGSDIPEVFETRVERRKAVRESADFKPLPDHVRQLFPSEFEESELGWVPKGWRSVDLTKMVDSISVTYPLKEVDKVIFLNTGDIDNGKFLVNEYSDSKGLPGQAKKSIQENDILFSEIRPKNKRFAFVNFDASDYVVSTKLMVLRAKNGFEPLLPYFLVTHDRTTTELQRVAELRSGTFPQITYKELEFISFLLPPNGGLLDFFVNKHLKPIYERSFSFSEENQTLEKLRDTLLPKLISGELRLDSPEVDQAKALVN
ncbi:restriction endonuclease subunit S [Vibrio rotiferianus]|uniref:restriction endonuclease subunit S n=1 Tax=Vibrio rotiferianus TaxID=190895 RepID=UPI0024901955|nr:restriction endonuclease subunit S [Vibrio rotiferianus]